MAHMGFGAVKAQLAAKGASNPGALAAFIGRKKYGAKGQAALAAAGQVKPGTKGGKAKKRRAADILKAANKAAPTSK